MQKSTLFSLLAAVVVTCYALPALADDEVYYIELDGDTAKTKDEAQKEWDELVAKHKGLLGKLKTYPKTIIENGQPVATRIQAGPIDGKVKAQKICNKLFSEKTPCFVLEGLSSAPPSRIVSFSEQSQAKGSSLPWLNPPPPVAESGKTAAVAMPVAAAPEEESPGFLSFLKGKKSEEQPPEHTILKGGSRPQPKPVQEAAEAPPPPPKPAPKPQPEIKPLVETTEEAAPENHEVNVPQGKVEVAEAIHVPLSDQELSENVPPSGEVTIKSLVDPHAAAMFSVAPGSENKPGWLNLDAFADEDAAAAFWQRVRTAAPQKAAGMRVRVVKPMAKSSQSRVLLNIGPFAGSADAASFCTEAVQPVDRTLRCRYEAREAPTGEAVAAVTQHGEVYNARRDAFAAEREAASGGASRRFWLEVASADNQIEAANAWDAMKSANGDILGSMRASVAPSPADKGRYIVRVGPMHNNEDAANLCTALQGRDISCKVFSAP